MRAQNSSATSRRNPHNSHMSASAPQLANRPPTQLAEITPAQSRGHANRPRHGTRATDGGWDTSPHAKVPEYNSDMDPHCPRAVVRDADISHTNLLCQSCMLSNLLYSTEHVTIVHITRPLSTILYRCENIIKPKS